MHRHTIQQTSGSRLLQYICNTCTSIWCGMCNLLECVCLAYIQRPNYTYPLLHFSECYAEKPKISSSARACVVVFGCWVRVCCVCVLCAFACCLPRATLLACWKWEILSFSYPCTAFTSVFKFSFRSSPSAPPPPPPGSPPATYICRCVPPR